MKKRKTKNLYYKKGGSMMNNLLTGKKEWTSFKKQSSILKEVLGKDSHKTVLLNFEGRVYATSNGYFIISWEEKDNRLNIPVDGRTPILKELVSQPVSEDRVTADNSSIDFVNQKSILRVDRETYSVGFNFKYLEPFGDLNKYDIRVTKHSLHLYLEGVCVGVVLAIHLPHKKKGEMKND